MVENSAKREKEFKKPMRSRNQVESTLETFGRNQNCPDISTTTKVLEEQLKVVHKVVDVVGRANRTCLTLLQCNVQKPEVCYAKIRLLVSKK